MLATAAWAQDAAGPSVDLLWGVTIPMRDRVHLNATVYKPAETKQPLPIILTMTPYISDSYHNRAMYFARQEYVFALVDVRGRGNSEGEFFPSVNDARDGYDVTEWLAVQPWCNGKVAMWGGSYAGFNQWATLKEAPSHLETIVPAAAYHEGVDGAGKHHIFYSFCVQWDAFTSGVTRNANLYDDSAFWASKFSKLYNQHLPFNTLDCVVGFPSCSFQEYVKHPVPDAYINSLAPTAEQYKEIEIPILSITGHYDDDQPGAMEYYRRHMRHGSQTGRESHYLIIGPWDHSGTRTPKREVGGLTFGEASLLDLNGLHREWYDWTMKDGAKPAFLKKRVAYYVVGPGAEVWKYADSLEAIPKETLTLYLHSRDGRAEDVFASGSLTQTEPGDELPDAYLYDPLDTRAMKLPLFEQNYSSAAYTDQTGVMGLSGRGLIYHSEPFAHATEITGHLKLTLWVELDVPDTDFWVDLYEILPDGSSVWLACDAKRARYRESSKEQKLVVPGRIERYVFDSFNFFSRRISSGSRLRLAITCPNTIYLEKNYNSGGVVAEESKKDARTAHVKVYHDAEHPSSLDIPLAR
jgi:putative CocE/NonD family hydrolase